MHPAPHFLAPAIMLDLETLDTRPSAAIWQLAAVAFVPATGEILAEHTTDIDVDDCLLEGCTIGRDTLAWWEARGGIQQTDPIPLWDALHALAAFTRLNAETGSHVWARGSDFDFPILKHAFSACDLDLPWKYYKQRDQRTLTDTARTRIDSSVVTHHALEDCRAQVRDLHASLVTLRLADPKPTAPIPYVFLDQPLVATL